MMQDGRGASDKKGTPAAAGSSGQGMSGIKFKLETAFMCLV